MNQLLPSLKRTSMRELWTCSRKRTVSWMLLTSTSAGETYTICLSCSIIWPSVIRKCNCWRNAPNVLNMPLSIYQWTSSILRKSPFLTEWGRFISSVSLNYNTVPSCHRSIGTRMPCNKLARVLKFATIWSTICTNFVNFMLKEKN